MTPQLNRTLNMMIMLASVFVIFFTAMISIVLELHPVSIIHIIIACTSTSLLIMVHIKNQHVTRLQQEQAKLDAVWNKLQGNQDENTDYLIY